MVGRSGAFVFASITTTTITLTSTYKAVFVTCLYTVYDPFSPSAVSQGLCQPGTLLTLSRSPRHLCVISDAISFFKMSRDAQLPVDIISE